MIVGFAAETGDATGSVLDLGRAKLARKGCDLLVVNDVSGGAVFGSSDNEAVILGADGGVRRGAPRQQDRAGPRHLGRGRPPIRRLRHASRMLVSRYVFYRTVPTEEASDDVAGRLFTSESVTEGHPDKIADRISDSVLDHLMAAGPRQGQPARGRRDAADHRPRRGRRRGPHRRLRPGRRHRPQGDPRHRLRLLREGLRRPHRAASRSRSVPSPATSPPASTPATSPASAPPTTSSTSAAPATRA